MGWSGQSSLRCRSSPIFLAEQSPYHNDVNQGPSNRLCLQLARRPAPHWSILQVRGQIQDGPTIAGDRKTLPRLGPAHDFRIVVGSSRYIVATMLLRADLNRFGPAVSSAFGRSSAAQYRLHLGKLGQSLDYQWMGAQRRGHHVGSR
jgi:hypothetical protein